MGFFGFLDPPQTRRHRQAAVAAGQLRQQAARDLYVELQVLVPFFRSAARKHQEAVAAGNDIAAARLANALGAAGELLDRVQRVAPELDAEVCAQKRAASCAADWERLASFEIDLRQGFTQMREQVKAHTNALMAAARS